MNTIHLPGGNANAITWCYSYSRESQKSSHFLGFSLASHSHMTMVYPFHTEDLPKGHYVVMVDQTLLPTNVGQHLLHQSAEGCWCNA